MITNRIAMTTVKFLLMLLVLPALALTACATKPAPVKSVPAGEEAYILGSGDALRIIVYGQEELSGEFKIDPSGQISIPLIRSVKAAGLTVRQLEDLIIGELEPDYVVDPKVSVEVLEYRSVYILGEVRTPGKYPYVPNMTVLQAVAVAGGHTYRANETSADVTRIEGDMLKTTTVRTDDMVLPGDTVIIKRRWF